jgi:hypothetical protein
MSVLKRTFIQLFLHFPGFNNNSIEDLRWIEKVGKVVIMKLQLDSMCICEAFLEKCKKNAGRKPSAAKF